ncbi:hypothetical protein LF807_24760 [Vibrio alginolyticus]|nr:hypothetical protein [Vibrio alginolyticus]
MLCEETPAILIFVTVAKHADAGRREKEKLLAGGGLGGEIKRPLGYSSGS